MRIFTHGWKAHADDMLACALLFLHNEDDAFSITRCGERDLPKVLEEGDFVVDIGGVYDGVNRFDHHQDEESVSGECAATLVAKAFFPELLQDALWGPYFKRVTVQDNQGLRTLEEKHGKLPPFLLLEWGVATLFEKDPEGIARMVAAILRDRLDFLKEVETAKDWLKDHSAVLPLGTGDRYMVLCIMDDPLALGLSVPAFNAAQAPILNSNDIVAVYSWDPRDVERKTRSLFRTKYGEEEGLNFNTSKAAQTSFCHKAGFLLNFVPENDLEWAKLIREARKSS